MDNSTTGQPNNSSQRWLPADFVAPLRVELESGNHLRPISPDDTPLDMIAVMGSQQRLWAIYGQAWGWPPADMTAEDDRKDLQRHAEEMSKNESFNYAVFDDAETALLGCIYIDPPERAGGVGAEVSWWVIDAAVGTPIEHEVAQFVPSWIHACWPIRDPRFVGIDLTWSEWLRLDEI